jgi:hypothetical protein
MKRAVMRLAVGVLILGSALSAMAQAPTVSFGGQMRVYGYSFNNITDFKDTAADGKGGQANKDSSSAYFQRFRLSTTIESADKKAKAFWTLEIGDITWGNGGGASGGEYNVGNASAGQTAPGATATSGGHRVEQHRRRPRWRRRQRRDQAPLPLVRGPRPAGGEPARRSPQHRLPDHPSGRAHGRRRGGPPVQLEERPDRPPGLRGQDQ